jgi:hypothetical protein
MNIVSIVNNYSGFALQFFNMRNASDGCALNSPSNGTAGFTLTAGGCEIPTLTLAFNDSAADLENWQQNRMIVAGPLPGDSPWAGNLWGFSFFLFEFPADPYPDQTFMAFTYDVGPVVPAVNEINPMLCLAVPTGSDSISIIIDSSGAVGFTMADSAGNPVPAFDPNTGFSPWWPTSTAAA